MTETLEAKQIAAKAENSEVLKMNIKKYQNYHQYPLMVDKLLNVRLDFRKGYKNISMNEPQFQGHFPGAPIMPGVLQVEALAKHVVFVF